MPKQKNIKFHIHALLNVPLARSRRETADNKFFLAFFYVGSGVLWFLKVVWAFCFFIGNYLIKIISAGLKFSKSQVKDTKASLKRRLPLLKNRKFAQSLGVFIFVALLGWGFFSSVHLVAKGLQIKTQIMQVSNAGKNYMQQAQVQLQSQNFDAANESFRLAGQSFTQGQQQLDKANRDLGNLLSLLPQTKDASSLLKAAGELSQTGQLAVDLYKNLQSLRITQQGVGGDVPFAQVVSSSKDDLNKISAHIASAEQGLQNINYKNLPSEDQAQFLAVQSQIQILNQNFGNFKDLASIIESILLGKKKVLVMFENSNELRATGGFMGTFGSFSLKDGTIENLNISSIYDLDGQLKDVISPPNPVLAVNQRWYLRDSNWFANFPDTAKKITEFYEKEGGSTPDLILAITPQFIVDSLKTLGPISLPKYNLTLGSDNFIEQTQVASSIDYNSPTNNPKQVLADFFPVFLQHLAQSSPQQVEQIVENLQNNLSEKQIVIYSADQQLEDKLNGYGWTGEILPSDRDYLSIVNSNLGGTKTDLYVNQSATLKSTINDQGQITNELTITRTNTQPKLDGTQNEDFMRIFVPQGAQLISNIGFDKKILLPQDPGNNITDPDVLNWEKSILTDQVTGTMIGQEAGKTFFGNWLNLEGGETRTVKLIYTLPFTVINIDHYSLLLQKQIGATDQQTDYELNFVGRKIEWKNFDTASLETNNLQANVTLNKDYLFGLVFSKR